MMNFTRKQSLLVISRKGLLCSSLLLALGASACGGKSTPDAVKSDAAKEITEKTDATVERIDQTVETNAVDCPIKIRKECSDSVTLTAADFPSRVGTLDGSSRVAAPGTAKGFVIFGPLATLKDGKYSFALNYDLDAPSDLTRKEMDSYSIIGSLGGKTTVFKKGQLDSSMSLLNLDVELVEDVEKVQFRVYYSGRSTLSVNNVTIKAKN